MVLVRRYFTREPSVLAAYAALAIVLLGWIMTTPNLTTLSLTVSISQKLPLVVATIGAAIVIMGKGIDLSVGASLTVVNVIIAAGGVEGPPSAVWIGVGLAVALLTGAVNGFCVAYLRLPALIVTLATQSVLFGIALYVLPTPGGSVDSWITEAPMLLIGPIPLSLLLIVLIPALTWYPLQATRFGPALLASGSDEMAAFSSGIRTRAVIMSTYVLSAFYAGLAGVLITMNAGSGDPTIGATYTLNTIAAAVVGGVALSGGRGTVAGPIAGALLISFINNLLFSMGINPYWQFVVTGLLLILAITIPLILRIRRRKKEAS